MDKAAAKAATAVEKFRAKQDAQLEKLEAKLVKAASKPKKKKARRKKKAAAKKK